MRPHPAHAVGNVLPFAKDWSIPVRMLLAVFEKGNFKFHLFEGFDCPFDVAKDFSRGRFALGLGKNRNPGSKQGKNHNADYREAFHLEHPCVCEFL